MYCVHLTQKCPKMEYNKDVCGDVLIAGLRENPALFNAGFQENLLENALTLLSWALPAFFAPNYHRNIIVTC